ncbi:hypothetical protein OS175_03360 [Marinicella sp. S1101]|uniref:hypothetical protein n=1 Tax=Marinicella marina TaxID=2996016 RepID=UPI002260946B|nr:hypothetical protein [Marinicella marina]MCX7552907.1 hypothetical protein [Marinicella marina]MDJ1139784.1 hypothetical protein [Marinicella marina]
MSKKITGFERLKKIAAAGAVGSMGLLGMGSGRAAPTSTGVTISVQSAVSVGTTVEVSDINDTTVSASSVLNGTATVSHNGTSYAFGIDDATLNSLDYSYSGPNFTGASQTGIETDDDLSDSYDGYGGIFLDGAPYNDTDGTVDLTGTTLTTDPDTMPNGLEVYSQYHVFTDKRVTRIIHAISNPTGAPITTRAAIGGNLGSDSNTNVPNTSDGDTNVELGDTWVITQDNDVFGGTATRDPILTHVVGAPGGIAAIPLQIPGAVGAFNPNTRKHQAKDDTDTVLGGLNANDNISFGYDVTVDPGQTQYITWFVQKSPNITETNNSLSDYSSSAAASAAGLFINRPAGMAGFGANWSGSVAGPAISVPILSPFGLLTLTGLVGFGAYRSSRKKAKK